MKVGYNLRSNFSTVGIQMVGRIVLLFCACYALSWGKTHSVCEVERTDALKAKEMIERILEEEPSNTACMLQLANINLKLGYIARGFELLVDAYSIDPHHVEKSPIATVLPFALKVTNLKTQAAKSNDKAIWNQLGDGYFEMGIFSEAALMYKNSLGVDALQHTIRLKLALALQKNTQIYSALEAVQKVLDVEPKHLFANYYMGKFIAHDIKDREGARPYLEQAKASLIAQKDTFGYLEYTNLLSDITTELGE
jgi:tetratricopeptide (TPR) repeat protein